MFVCNHRMGDSLCHVKTTYQVGVLSVILRLGGQHDRDRFKEFGGLICVAADRSARTELADLRHNAD